MIVTFHHTCKSTVLNFFMLNKNLFSLHLQHLKHLLFLFNFQTFTLFNCYVSHYFLFPILRDPNIHTAFTIYRFVLYTHVRVKPVLLTTLFATLFYRRNSSVLFDGILLSLHLYIASFGSVCKYKHF